MPQGKSIIFVGNAPSLRGAKLKQWIESHDIVIRFNQCALADFDADVGRRTDILVSNPYVENRRPLLDGVTSPGTIFIIASLIRRGDKTVFEKWAGDNAVLFTYKPDLKTLACERHDISLMTGTYAVPLICRLSEPSRVSLTGFTMFLEGTAHHYWESQSPRGLRVHSPVREASIFIDLLNSIAAKIEVTSDIAWVAQRAEKKLRKNIVVRSLAAWTAPSIGSDSLVQS
jgi:hypothetical protein